ncbi:hypothetical protein Ddye_010756 [Dipteronia dyeriana]|uniref:Uncharacterized protein n=1 Tax=Dipteronia dyeriana TaxID=168575 RepID=A0AAD9XDY2_9ROSI|nr:hypothetical protein Ddye_010756 [Dipteronia dyeriana]
MKQRAKRPKSAIMKPKSKLLFIVRIQGQNGYFSRFHAPESFHWSQEEGLEEEDQEVWENKTAAALAKKEGEEDEDATASPA